MKRLKTEAPHGVVLLSALAYLKTEYFDSAMSYGNLRKALNKCCRNVRWKDSVAGYELHAPRNTYDLMVQIRNGTYKMSPYQQFRIYEPKVRDILATRIRDRQVQMALCEGGLYKDLTEHFIYDNCACQKGKGTDFALKRVRVHLSRFFRKHGKNGWVLKLDVHHFFPTTRHDVAKQAVAKRVKDPKACQYVFNVIDSFGGDVGIGLASQISQLVELAVLDDIDHFIKERLKIKHYVRYMDDFLIIHESKEYLRYCKIEIEWKLNEIHLELNEKTTIYPLSQGVKFLKWRFILSDTGKITMKMSGEKMGRERRRLKRILKQEATGRLEKGTAERSLQSWLANANRGGTYYQQKRMIAYFEKEKSNDNDLRTAFKSRT